MYDEDSGERERGVVGMIDSSCICAGGGGVVCLCVNSESGRGVYEGIYILGFSPFELSLFSSKVYECQRSSCFYICFSF